MSQKIIENPFFVLGLSPDASRIEIEREAQKLLGMLELDFPAARIYQTPLGDQHRTAEAVRAAVAALRDPYQRLVAELWARHAPETASWPPQSDKSENYRWTELRARMGWKP